mgnify:CR=1 FL=1
METGKIIDHVEQYYNEWGCNCCETVLHAANDAWGLHLPEQAFKLAGGFGGGCGCGNLCGAVAGGLQAMGCLFIPGVTAHQSPEMQKRSGMLVETVEQRLGGSRCDWLKPRHRTDAEHCLPTIRLIAAIIDEVKDAPLPRED